MFVSPSVTRCVTVSPALHRLHAVEETSIVAESRGSKEEKCGHAVEFSQLFLLPPWQRVTGWLLSDVVDMIYGIVCRCCVLAGVLVVHLDESKKGVVGY